MQQLFIVYGYALFYTVFFTYNRYRGDGSVHINLVPIVETARQFNEQGNQNFWPYYIGYWGNIFGNIILFVPFGFLFQCLYSKTGFSRIYLYGLLLSISIETIQLILRIGVCDIDDVILNVLGVTAGVALFRVMRKKKPGWFAGIQSAQ